MEHQFGGNKSHPKYYLDINFQSGKHFGVVFILFLNVYSYITNDKNGKKKT